MYFHISEIPVQVAVVRRSSSSSVRIRAFIVIPNDETDLLYIHVVWRTLWLKNPQLSTIGIRLLLSFTKDNTLRLELERFRQVPLYLCPVLLLVIILLNYFKSPDVHVNTYMCLIIHVAT